MAKKPEIELLRWTKELVTEYRHRLDVLAGADQRHLLPIFDQFRSSSGSLDPERQFTFEQLAQDREAYQDAYTTSGLNLSEEINDTIELTDSVKVDKLSGSEPSS